MRLLLISHLAIFLVLTIQAEDIFKYKNKKVQLGEKECTCSFILKVDGTSCRQVGRAKCNKKCRGRGIVNIEIFSFDLKARRGKAVISNCKALPNPKYWIPFLKNPCDPVFKICAPNPKCVCAGSQPRPPVQNIGIVGAGMAGLTMAWILQFIGHNVTLIEATDRVGGRVFTHYGTGWYGDLGAMRFPPENDHPLLHQLFDQFKIPLQSFTNTNEGSSSYFHLNGRSFSSEDYATSNQSVLKRVYEAFGIATNGENGRFPKLNNGTLQNPSSSILKLPKVEDCLQDESLEHTYRKVLNRENLPLELINLWSVLELRRAFLPVSYQSMYDTPQEHQRRAKDKKFQEAVNGSSVIPETILNNLTNVDNSQEEIFKKRNVDIKYNSPVKQVTINEDDTVTLNHVDTFDKVILTPTSRVVSLMQFSPPLAYDKTFALNSFHFANSVKVFLAFHTPFWATENRIHKIPFNSTKTNGGSGITDLPIRSVYYPSHPNHGYSILVSYVWGSDADRLTALSEEDLIQKSLANLVEIHGQIANTTYKEGRVVKWLEEDWTVGAFPLAFPGQMKLGDALRAPHGSTPRVFFAGEYTSKFDHGWIQAALESACRVSHDMFR